MNFIRFKYDDYYDDGWNFYTTTETISILSLTMLARMYPLSTSTDRLFFGAEVGFDRLGIKSKISGGSSYSDNWLGLCLGVNTGYRINLNEKYFIEPLFGYKISKTGMMAAMFDMPADLFGTSGFHVDLAIGLRF